MKAPTNPTILTISEDDKLLIARLLRQHAEQIHGQLDKARTVAAMSEKSLPAVWNLYGRYQRAVGLTDIITNGSLLVR